MKRNVEEVEEIKILDYTFIIEYVFAGHVLHRMDVWYKTPEEKKFLFGMLASRTPSKNKYDHNYQRIPHEHMELLTNYVENAMMIAQI